MKNAKALEPICSEWLNASSPVELKNLQGKVVVIFAFQMLCPGCVSHCIPQAKRLYEMTDQNQLAVLGLHTVFEHHEAMRPDALKAFLSEYQIFFPVGIDRQREDHHIPETMAEYQMQGTPTTIVIDRQGKLQLNRFGLIDDIALGAVIGGLLTEKRDQTVAPAQNQKPQGCEIRTRSNEPTLNIKGEMK